MTEAILLLLTGTLLSAFYSGSESGLYRVNRMRLVLDALDGDWIARSLLALVNHASLFVATVLVGNNVANYLTSLAVVMGVRSLLPVENQWAEILAPVILAPLLFVSGELMPKKFYYQAPNRLLRRSVWALGFSVILFLPVTAVLWSLSRLLSWISGISPAAVQVKLARSELAGVLDEGHHEGLLTPTQRELAQSLFAVAHEPVSSLMIPVQRIPHARLGMTPDALRRLAQRHRLSLIPVREPRPSGRVVGYYRVYDLYLHPDAVPALQTLLQFADNELHIVTMMRLQSSTALMGQVVDSHGQTVGYVTARHLSEPLLLS